MATKDNYSSFKHNPKDFMHDNSGSQYDNLNLNQNHQSLTLNHIPTKNVVFNEKKFPDNGVDNLQKTKNNNSSDGFKKNLPSNYLNIESGIEDEKTKVAKKSNISSSTLSLHITAFENSIETRDEIPNWDKASKNTKKNIAASEFATIKNPFEFPRQQKEDGHINESEVMQFKASQKLLNPEKVEENKFYNSLDDTQKQMFQRIQRQHDEEILAIKIDLHDKEEECEKLTAKIASVMGDSQQHQVPRKGVDYHQILKDELLTAGVDIDNENQQPVTITNYIYYRLSKLFPKKPYQKRLIILKLLGLSCHVHDATVLSTNFLKKFDKSFSKTRENERSNKKLPNFDNEIITFPKEQIPIITPTVTENASEVGDTNESEMPPSLEAMVMDTGEPLPKKIRIEPEIVNLPSTANTESQTDLKLKNILDLEESKRKLKSLNQKVTYHKGISGSLKEVNKEYEKLIADLEEESQEFDEMENLIKSNEKLKAEVRERDKINLELNDQLENHKKGNKFFLKNARGHFTVAAHACFSRLIAQGGVAQVKVGMVILILAEYFKIAIDAVPSRWTVGRDIHMIHSLNCEYIINFINDCTNLSWLSDETTKFFKKIQANVLAGRRNKTQQNAICYVGFGEVPDKSAARCLEEFKLLLSNIAKIGKLDVEKFIGLVVINIRNCMGDQASTTKLVYSLFIAFRDFCLENSHFDESTKASLQRVNCFFCMLHILSNSSAIVFNALLNHEKFCTKNEEVTEATVLWVLNEVPRYFAKRSSGKHSTAAQWETLRKELELKFSKIDSNIGHRFIIRFKIASEIVHNLDEIIAFLENLGNEDETLINLKNALQNDLVILHLHILALLGALILQPMWQLSDKSESILQMSLYAPALLKYLKELIEDPMLIFTVNSPFDAFPGAAPKENSKASVFLKSLKERPIPAGGSEVVPMVAKELLEYFEKQLDPFVTGAYSSPDIALERETAGAPLTNMACESGFGYMDHLFTTKPHMTTYNRSVLTVAVKNNLFEYVTKLPDEEQNAMFLRAFDNKKLSAQLAAEKAQQIHRENVERIEQQALKQQLEKQKQKAKRKKIAIDLRECGFWLTIPEMEAALQDVPRATALKYIKSNIRYRKAVWNPEFEPKNFLQFSYKKHIYTYSELEGNLRAVIAADFSPDDFDENLNSDSEED